MAAAGCCRCLGWHEHQTKQSKGAAPDVCRLSPCLTCLCEWTLSNCSTLHPVHLYWHSHMLQELELACVSVYLGNEHALAKQCVGNLQKDSNHVGPIASFSIKSRSKAFRCRLIRHEVAIGPACTSPCSCLHQSAPTIAPSAPMIHFAAHRACPQAHSCHRQRLHAHPRPALTSMHMCTLYQYAALVSFAPWKPIHRAAS